MEIGLKKHQLESNPKETFSFGSNINQGGFHQDFQKPLVFETSLPSHGRGMGIFWNHTIQIYMYICLKLLKDITMSLQKVLFPHHKKICNFDFLYQRI